MCTFWQRHLVIHHSIITFEIVEIGAHSVGARADGGPGPNGPGSCSSALGGEGLADHGGDLVDSAAHLASAVLTTRLARQLLELVDGGTVHIPAVAKEDAERPLGRDTHVDLLDDRDHRELLGDCLPEQGVDDLAVLPRPLELAAGLDLLLERYHARRMEPPGQQGHGADALGARDVGRSREVVGGRVDVVDTPQQRRDAREGGRAGEDLGPGHVKYLLSENSPSSPATNCGVGRLLL